MAEPGWKLASLVIITNMKWTYLSLHANSTRVSPEKRWDWITRNSPDMQSGVARELTIWWAARSNRVIEGLTPWGDGVIARLMIEAFVLGPDNN